jgi:hypothetical protein
MHQHEELHSPELCRYLITEMNKKKTPGCRCLRLLKRQSNQLNWAVSGFHLIIALS